MILNNVFESLQNAAKNLYILFYKKYVWGLA
jgi:hypothetical protein